MPTYTQSGSVWISAGGEVLCKDHGGSYLTTAIAAGDGPHIFTPLDDWIYHSPETAAEYDLVCEVCRRTTTCRADGGAESVRPPLESSITNGKR